MKDKTIKMVALDLDGTTLNPFGELTPRTIQAFQAAMEQNIHIVICTGRTYSSLPEQLLQIPGLEYIVTSNGAQITRLADEQIIYENNIAPEAIEQIAAMLRPLDYSVEIFSKGKAYIAKEEYEQYLREGSSFRDVQYILQTRNPIPHFYAFMLEHQDAIENINISFPRQEDRVYLTRRLEEIANITLTSSFVHNIEVGGATTSKADALRYLLDLTGLSTKQLMAVGDSHNDLAMIQLAEVGVVMGNAAEEMKRHADYIADDNAHDGVAKMIEKCL